MNTAATAVTKLQNSDKNTDLLEREKKHVTNY